MPKNTKVHRCVDKLKAAGKKSPYAICQSSTGQSYKTGKKLRKKHSKSSRTALEPR